MSEIKIFICYKKILSQDGRLLHKNTEAEMLYYILKEDERYSPWMDTALTAGMRWEMEIYSQLLDSDVLIALIGPGTAQSEWVRREIALAKALGISVIPLGFSLTDEQMEEETKNLHIYDIQWIRTESISLSRRKSLLLEVEEPLRRAAISTQREQQATLRAWAERRKPHRQKARDNQKAASFQLPDPNSATSLHVASGDIVHIRGVDVFVNTENDYMQMARFFESRTVSSILRSRGSLNRGGEYDDTIQKELDRQLQGRGRPVQPSEVFPTSAGHPKGDLTLVNKARVLLHVAAVQSVAADARVIPFKESHQIASSVRSALDAMAAINAADGVFSPVGTAQRIEQERLASMGLGHLGSIVFPLLGTGQGGATAAEVVSPMLDAIIDFLGDARNEKFSSELQDIYIAAYTQEDVNVVTSELGRRLRQTTG